MTAGNDTISSSICDRSNMNNGYSNKDYRSISDNSQNSNKQINMTASVGTAARARGRAIAVTEVAATAASMTVATATEQQCSSINISISSSEKISSDSSKKIARTKQNLDRNFLTCMQMGIFNDSFCGLKHHTYSSHPMPRAKPTH